VGNPQALYFAKERIMKQRHTSKQASQAASRLQVPHYRESRENSLEPCTVQTVHNLYLGLTDEDQAAFRRLLGQRMTAEALFLLWDALPLVEQGRFIALLDQGTCTVVMDKLALEAIRVARQQPPADEAELVETVKKRTAAYHHEINQLIKAEVKKARDPQKRQVDRDREILRLAKQGKTAGVIQLDIQARWSCTPGAVHQVIRRAKQDGRLPK
jgi:hypothetical protein